MDIVVVLGAWCAFSVVVGLAFGQSVRSREPGGAPAAPAAAVLPEPAATMVAAAGSRR